MEKNFEADFPTETITEGKAQIVVPKLKAFVTEPSDYAPSKAPVFYNPVMEFNRDVTVLAFQASWCEPSYRLGPSVMTVSVYFSLFSSSLLGPHTNCAQAYPPGLGSD